ncbi:MAG: hypothetical protein DPW18_05670 [Chloroflexi bacterium]|nr:hypothetical protein [Chloroflexota bacterium]MDL1942460.1 hypothetical protein [Chloroflexi bacterium CFX2]
MNFIKRIAWFEVLLVAVILGIHIYASLADDYVFPNNWFKRDDAYYYFKVAQNISEGRGSTFDGINPTNGYHPLWMLICIPIFALARFDLILPLRVLLVVIAVIHAATALLLYRLVKKHLSHAVAILAAAFWSFNDYIHATVYELGLETPIAAFAVVLLIYKLSQFEESWRTGEISKKQLAGLALFAALAMFGRLDLVFLAVIAGVWIVFRGSPIRFLLPLDILLIFVSMTASVLLRTDFNTYNTTYASSAVEAALIALVVKIPILYFLGAYRHPRAAPVWKTLRQAGLALAISMVVVAVVYILFVQLGLGRNFPRSAFLLDFGISLALFTASRLAAHWFADPKRTQPESPLVQFKANWKTWLSEGAVYYGLLGGLLAVYMLFNQVMFGTSSPVSGQIKRWWGSMASTAYERPASSWASFFGMDAGAFETWQPFSEVFWKISEHIRPIIPGADKVDERYFAVLFTFILAAWTLVFFNKRRALQAVTMLGGIPLLAGSGIHILSYTATSYGGAKEWYWISQMILLTLTASLLFDLILRPLRRIQYARFALTAGALVYAGVSANALWGMVHYIMPHGRFSPNRPYMEVVAYIEKNTFPGEIIGMTGGGNVGYLIKDRTIVNMDGLINSYDYFHALQNGDAPVYLRQRGMTVVFANPRLLALPPYYGQFAPYLERYSSYGGKDLLYLLEEPKY